MNVDDDDKVKRLKTQKRDGDYLWLYWNSKFYDRFIIADNVL